MPYESVITYCREIILHILLFHVYPILVNVTLCVSGMRPCLTLFLCGYVCACARGLGKTETLPFPPIFGLTTFSWCILLLNSRDDVLSRLTIKSFSKFLIQSISRSLSNTYILSILYLVFGCRSTGLYAIAVRCHLVVRVDHDVSLFSLLLCTANKL